MISVVIPLYNKAATVQRAITSVLNQTYQDFELIVVNNGSTDGGQEIVRQMTDKRIILLEQENRGVSMARNRGISESKSEWIAFLDADDEWKPTFLETVILLRDKYKDCAVCATSYQRCDSHGNIEDISLDDIPNADDFRMDDYFNVASKSEPPFCSISVMIRKDALTAIGGFPQEVNQGEDLLTWARLAAKYKIAYCRKPQSIFYTGEQPSMGTPKRIPADDDIVGRELENIYHEHPHNGLKEYIAKWHKMRASMYLRLDGKAWECRHEIRIAQRWHHNKRLAVYTILSYFPYNLRMKILRRI